MWNKKSHTHTHTFETTHQTLSSYTHIIGANIEAGGPVSDTLCLTDVETIASRSAGQLALLVCTNCNAETQGSRVTTQHVCHSQLSLCLCMWREVFFLSLWQPWRRKSWRMNVFPCGQETKARPYNPREGEWSAISPAAHCCTLPGDTHTEKRCNLKLEKGKIYERKPKDARSRAKMCMETESRRTEEKGHCFKVKQKMKVIECREERGR